MLIVMGKKYFLFCLFFIGCAPKFDNPDINNPIIKKKKLEIDSAKCKLYALEQVEHISNNGIGNGSFTLYNNFTGKTYTGNYQSKSSTYKIHSAILESRFYILCMKAKGWKVVK